MGVGYVHVGTARLGAMLLLRQQYPDATPAELKDLLERTATLSRATRSANTVTGASTWLERWRRTWTSRPRGGIELFVYEGDGFGVPNVDVTLYRGDTPVRRRAPAASFGTFRRCTTAWRGSSNWNRATTTGSTSAWMTSSTEAVRRIESTASA